MKNFLTTLHSNFAACFRGRMVLWHLLAIALTAICVFSGFDWYYYTSTRNPALQHWMFQAAPLGWWVPIFVPPILIAAGYVASHRPLSLLGWAIGQAAVLGSLISSAYKALTGRVHPLHTGAEDISHIFRFGFLRGGVFWGWPSSHTTIAFAMAVALFTLLPKQRWLGGAALAYAVFIGVGVSMTIHWFSDFAAGAIIGTVIGRVVAHSFSQTSSKT